jgi:hypothetical protein
MFWVLLLVVAAVVGTMIFLHHKHNAAELALEAKLKELEEKVVHFFENLGHK